jgi:His/Glu/Gln/Arg/opine family amino acid ABC transporter permease subunit
LNFSHYVFGEPYFDWLCRGVMMTLVITAASSVGAILIGFPVFCCRASRLFPLHAAATAYVIVFRNLPLVPLIFFLTFGIPGSWQQLTGHPFFRGSELYLLLLALAMNTAAYLSEIMRAGVTAVDPEQIEVSRTLGMSLAVIRRQIVYPQAVRIVAPALASRFIHNMKNSALALIVPLPVQRMEVVGQASRIAGQTFTWAEPLIFAACIHLALALGLGELLDRWARRKQAAVTGAK